MIAKQEKERSPIFDPKTEEAIVNETLEGGYWQSMHRATLGVANAHGRQQANPGDYREGGTSMIPPGTLISTQAKITACFAIVGRCRTL